jgi:hypothetical protein
VLLRQEIPSPEQTVHADEGDWDTVEVATRGNTGPPPIEETTVPGQAQEQVATIVRGLDLDSPQGG